MKSILTLTIGLTLAGLSACGSPSNTVRPNQLQGTHNMWVGDELRRQSVEKAVTLERAVYEHHFVPGTAELNPLGLRDLELLARHFSGHGGNLDVRRGQASDALYAERRATVRSELAAAGIEPERIADAQGLLEIRSTEATGGR